MDHDPPRFGDLLLGSRQHQGEEPLAIVVMESEAESNSPPLLPRFRFAVPLLRL